MCVIHISYCVYIHIYIYTYIMMYLFYFADASCDNSLIENIHVICWRVMGKSFTILGKLCVQQMQLGQHDWPPPKAMLYCRLFWQTLRFQEMAKRRRVHPEPRLATSGHGRAIDNVSIVVREEKEKHRFIKEQWPKFGLTRSLRPS